jgi:hypothetical protein
MSNNLSQFENAAQSFLKSNPPLVAKYYSATLLQTLVNAMQSSLPTVTAAKITFDRLVANGSLLRTDGKSEADDRVEAVATAEARFNQVVAETDTPPLTAAEIQEFSSLGREELSRRYWKDDGMNTFRVRYDRAVREHMFRVPGRIQAVDALAVEGELTLTAAEYHSIPSAELQRRLRNPSFKQQVYLLLKSGAI